jgi:hypothetical protein
MTNQTKHTPTPLSIEFEVDMEHLRVIRDADGGLIAMRVSPVAAEFIVRAVNAHDDLVKALRLAKSSLAREYGVPLEECTGGEFVAINDALTKAEGR